jgi:hypothetical protein
MKLLLESLWIQSQGIRLLLHVRTYVTNYIQLHLRRPQMWLGLSGSHGGNYEEYHPLG